MTTTVTTSSTGPLTANGVTPIPFDFQSISSTEIQVERAGLVMSPATYTVQRNADGTGSITPLVSWGTDEVIITSIPDFTQPVGFQRFGAFYPDQINPPLDRLARSLLALKRRTEEISGGDDALLRSDLLALTGAAQINTLAAGTGALTRSVRDKLRDTLHRLDFSSLQEAVTAAATQGKALYLGDTDFTQATTVVIPDADLTIIGPGAGSLTITFTGTGGMFVGTGLSAGTNIDIGGFTARAGAANCGRPVDLDYTTSSGINTRAIRLHDIVADFTGAFHWSGGVRIDNARNSVLDAIHVHGPTADLTKTADGIQIRGEATDVKISNCMMVSVGIGADIGEQAEGTIFDNWVVVDANIGVQKYHTGGSEPWLAMSNWHMNVRQKGFVLRNVLQVTVGSGLLYCQNGSGAFIGIHIEAGDSLNQDHHFGDVIIDAQLAGGGVTSSTAIKVDAGNRISGRIIARSVGTGISLASGVTNCQLLLEPQAVTTLTTGAGFVEPTNRCIINHPTLGYGLPLTSGPYNPDTSNVPKSAQSYAFGLDTIGTVKTLGGYRSAGLDSNFTGAALELYARISDALTMVAQYGDKTILFNRLAALDFANDAAAATGGVPVGGLYHNAGAVRMRVS